MRTGTAVRLPSLRNALPLLLQPATMWMMMMSVTVIRKNCCPSSRDRIGRCYPTTFSPLSLRQTHARKTQTHTHSQQAVECSLATSSLPRTAFPLRVAAAVRGTDKGIRRIFRSFSQGKRRREESITFPSNHSTESAGNKQQAGHRGGDSCPHSASPASSFAKGKHQSAVDQQQQSHRCPQQLSRRRDALPRVQQEPEDREQRTSCSFAFCPPVPPSL